jgi:hypothetical protein
VRVVDGSSDGAMFVTNGVQTTETAAFAGKCWLCKETGHRKSECPLATKQQQSGTQLLINAMATDDSDNNANWEFMFNMVESGDEDLKNWILLDNQSTVNIFCNPRLNCNIRTADKPLSLR